MHNKAIVLIGMPGAGKSTLGVLLAKQLSRPFIDTDLLIQEQAGCTLQYYLDRFGYVALRELEAQVVAQMDYGNAVVATGGSVVYSESAMAKLGTAGQCIYLKVSLAQVEARVKNISSRGLACEPGTTLEQLYAERQALYERYADHTVDLQDLKFDQSLHRLQALLDANYQN